MAIATIRCKHCGDSHTAEGPDVVPAITAWDAEHDCSAKIRAAVMAAVPMTIAQADEILAAIGAYIRDNRTPSEVVGTALPTYSGERKAFREGYEVAMDGMLHLLRLPRTVEDPAA